jgi:hypothetical protein
LESLNGVNFTMDEHMEHKKEERKHTSHKKKKSGFKIKKKAMWQAATAVLAILLIASIATKGGCKGTGDAVSADEAGEKTVEFINTFMTDGNVAVDLKNVSEESSMYMVNFEVQGQTYPSYVSKDGKFLFLQVIDMDKASEDAESGETPAPAQAPEIPKSEKPEVEVFVMSHCPYGTQIEKGILPVAELLGGKIDFSVKFVYYAMHGKTEIDEQLNQHCIQEEEPEKFVGYLSCFLKEGDGEGCLSEEGIDTAKIDSCVEATDTELGITEKFEDRSTWLNDRFPLFDVDKDLNTKYGVKGSPNLVINGVSASAGRDSASLLGAVCASFTDSPEECDTELSSAQPSPGFGFEATGNGAEGRCG